MYNKLHNDKKILIEDKTVYNYVGGYVVVTFETWGRLQEVSRVFY